MLLLNGIRSYGGSPLTLMGQHWHHFFADSMLAASMNSAGFGKTSAIPRGYYPPAVVAIAVTAGQMSLDSSGSGDMEGDLYPSRNMVVALQGDGGLTALGALVVSLLVAMSGSGSLAGGLSGRLEAVAAMTGAGGISSAAMTALGEMVAALNGSGDIDATIRAWGDMEIDIVVTGTGLNSENVGQAVWNTLIEGGFTAAQLQRLMAAALAGKVSGGGTGTLTFRDLNDLVDRIVADVASGNRTDVVLDPD